VSAHGPALPLPRPLPDRETAIRLGLPLLAALLLGVALGTDRPQLALVAVLPFALAVALNPRGAIVAFGFGFYLNLPVILMDRAGLPGAVAGMFVLLLGVPVIRHLIVERQPVVLTPAIGLMIAYLLSMVLSAILTDTPSAQATNAITTFLTEGLLLVLLVTNALRSPGALRAFIWALLAAGALMGLISVWQELTHAYSNTLGGLAQVNEEGFGVGEGAFGKEVRPRLAGPIGEQNRFAQVLLVLIPLAIMRVRAEEKASLKLLAAGMGALITAGVLLSFSRSAFVALVLLVVVMALAGFVAVRHVLALGTVLVALVLVVAPDYVLRIQSLTDSGTSVTQSGDGEQVDGALQGRATENLAALNAFKDHPIFGVGPEQFFKVYSVQYGNELGLRFLEENRRAHNLYLEMGADLGIVGLLAFLAVVVVTMAHLWILSRFWRERRPDFAILAMGCLMSLAAYMLSGAFLQLSFQRYFWILIALSNATIWVLRHERADEPAGPAAA
jgi:putative inorganic carbon (hco3(-)) transporter